MAHRVLRSGWETSITPIYKIKSANDLWETIGPQRSQLIYSLTQRFPIAKRGFCRTASGAIALCRSFEREAAQPQMLADAVLHGRLVQRLHSRAADLIGELIPLCGVGSELDDGIAHDGRRQMWRKTLGKFLDARACTFGIS